LGQLSLDLVELQSKVLAELGQLLALPIQSAEFDFGLGQGYFECSDKIGMLGVFLS
jgi:hypothetical protein